MHCHFFHVTEQKKLRHREAEPPFRGHTDPRHLVLTTKCQAHTGGVNSSDPANLRHSPSSQGAPDGGGVHPRPRWLHLSWLRLHDEGLKCEALHGPAGPSPPPAPPASAAHLLSSPWLLLPPRSPAQLSPSGRFPPLLPAL